MLEQVERLMDDAGYARLEQYLSLRRLSLVGHSGLLAAAFYFPCNLRSLSGMYSYVTGSGGRCQSDGLAPVRTCPPCEATSS